MDYIDAATTGILPPHILHVQDLQQMPKHIEDTLPPMMYLPISSEDTLHFYRYLHTHVLIANEQFLLLIEIMKYLNGKHLTETTHYAMT